MWREQPIKMPGEVTPSTSIVGNFAQTSQNCRATIREMMVRRTKPTERICQVPRQHQLSRKVRHVPFVALKLGRLGLTYAPLGMVLQYLLGARHSPHLSQALGLQHRRLRPQREMNPVRLAYTHTGREYLERRTHNSGIT